MRKETVKRRKPFWGQTAVTLGLSCTGTAGSCRGCMLWRQKMAFPRPPPPFPALPALYSLAGDAVILPPAPRFFFYNGASMFIPFQYDN